MKKLKTPLRYPGGKSRAVKKLFEFFPDLNKYDEYREPFIGGGSVAIAVTKQYPHLKVWVNDKYWNLYNFWVQLRDNGEELSDVIYELKQTNSKPEEAKQLFLQCKETLDDPESTRIEKAICFWIVNKCSFSGLTESASFSAQSSVSNFTLNGAENLREYSKLIKNWVITNTDYSDLLKSDSKWIRNFKTFIYLDPPYEIGSNLYGKKGNMHKGFDHDEFAKKCNIVDIEMAISYNADQSVKDRFPDWRQEVFDLTYTMRSVGEYMEKQKERKELLLLNYEV